MHEFPDFITALPEVDLPFAGASGHVLQGEKQQAVFISFAKDLSVPEHSHRAQWELVLAGTLTLRMRGMERICRPGDSFYIPEGVLHSADVRAGYRAIIFFDQADRYRPK